MEIFVISDIWKFSKNVWGTKYFLHIRLGHEIFIIFFIGVPIYFGIMENFLRPGVS